MATEKFPRKMADGDWICNDAKCGNVNFARRTTCNRCGTDKPLVGPKVKKSGVEIGKHLAEKSKGLFSADDWQCAKCGNVNWARRKDCNMCNAARYGPIEERTGLGGGFNERDNVEYNEHVSDEDELYDEFGRLKKGKVRDDIKDTTSSSIKPIEDDEDDDEDDEDGDLSKYQLDSDDDEKSGDDLSKYQLEDEKDDKSDQGSRSRKRPASRSRSGSRSSSSSSRSRSYSSSSRSSSSSSQSRSRSGSRQKHRTRSRSRSPHRHKRHAAGSLDQVINTNTEMSDEEECEISK
ncbi:PREDICTED: zinc finger Ran-binding domain-containing protein 2-like isoform X2 [Priapulus caudatus]|uniref:Zinc finger Ran-binding domain-containing protein 2 n=1 Tax=Priapulus caudatus TaxID=37621 RepID=A0ABM1DRH3_PRICU|nr:PREDICTED: zinc finger Ran-binding domain-containing protein 2-like isoform X2 [Priapulus caudatus]